MIRQQLRDLGIEIDDPEIAFDFERLDDHHKMRKQFAQSAGLLLAWELLGIVPGEFVIGVARQFNPRTYLSHCATDFTATLQRAL